MNRRIQQALEQAVQRLRSHDQPRLDAEVLLAHALNKPRSYLHAWPDAPLSPEQWSRFQDLVRQRAEGRPVAHLTGHREFWSLDLEVTTDTLIPRPETELLVEQTLALLPDHEPLRVADFGTGSGAIAVALAHERRHWQLFAIDRSLPCLEVARRNALGLGLSNLSFINTTWSEAIAGGCLDAMVANPPYVTERDPHLRQGDVRFEPASALRSGPEGLDDLRKLIEDASRVLKAGGRIFLEHSPEQTERVHKLLNNINFLEIETHRDLAGLERVSVARKSG